MPQFYVEGEPHEYNSSSEENGTTTYYDENGNPIARQTAPKDRRDWPKTEWTKTDPETGNTVWYTESRAGGGRGDRRTDRNRKSALYHARMDASRARYGDAVSDMDSVYDGAEDYLPSELDLMGGVRDLESNVQVDAGEGRDAQLAALRQLQALSRNGYTAQEEAKIQDERRRSAAFEQQQRQAAMNRLAMRGIQGSGQATAAALAAQQGGANRQNQAQLETQAMASQRALQALQGTAQLGGQMRSDSFRERSELDNFNFANLGRIGGANQQAWQNRSGLMQDQYSSAADRARQSDEHTAQTWQMYNQGKKNKADIAFDAGKTVV